MLLSSRIIVRFVQPADITVLMADRAKLTGSLKYNELDTGKPFKRFWVDNWISPDASMEWDIKSAKAGEYETVLLVEGALGTKIEIRGPGNTLICELVSSGWNKIFVPANCPFLQEPAKLRLDFPKPRS